MLENCSIFIFFSWHKIPPVPHPLSSNLNSSPSCESCFFPHSFLSWIGVAVYCHGSWAVVCCRVSFDTWWVLADSDMFHIQCSKDIQPLMLIGQPIPCLALCFSLLEETQKTSPNLPLTLSSQSLRTRRASLHFPFHSGHWDFFLLYLVTLWRVIFAFPISRWLWEQSSCWG